MMFYCVRRDAVESYSALGSDDVADCIDMFTNKSLAGMFCEEIYSCVSIASN